jgi:hypothetical protein
MHAVLAIPPDLGPAVPPHSLLQAVDNDVSLQDIHAGAEKFSPLVEQVFKYLQIISAAAMSFAHGANDVANAVGPFAAIYGIYKYGYISSKSQVEMWMLAGIGATGGGQCGVASRCRMSLAFGDGLLDALLGFSQVIACWDHAACAAHQHQLSLEVRWR